MAKEIEISILKTVALAAAKNSNIPILDHFCFYDDRVQCCDSVITIDAPCRCGIETVAPVKQFMATISDAKDVTFSLKKKLTIKTDKIRASFSVLDNKDYPLMEAPTGKQELTSALLPALRRLQAFINDNSNVTWSTGILIKGGFGYATNNIIMARDKLMDMPQIVIPGRLVDILLRINKEPTHYSVQENAIYFWFDDMWLKSSLLEDTWPNAEKVIDGAKRNNVFSIASLKDDLIRIKKFDTSKHTATVEFDGTNIRMNDATSDVTMPCSMDESLFKLDSLITVANHADIIHINWPEPCYFECSDGSMDGVIVGLKRI